MGCTNCYNSAMGEKFQFSLRRLLASVVLLSIAAWLLSISLRPSEDLSPRFERPAEFLGANIIAIAAVAIVTEKRARKLYRPPTIYVVGLIIVFFIASIL